MGRFIEIVRIVFALALLPLISCELAARVYYATLPGHFDVSPWVAPDALRAELMLSTVWDNRGFYGPVYPAPAADNRPTLWVLGSSVMYGQFTLAGESVPDRLQAMLPGYRVVNLAVPGQLAVNMWRQAQTLPIHAGDVVLMESATMDAYSAYSIQANRATQCMGLAAVQFVCRPKPDAAMAAQIAADTLAAVRSTRDYVLAHHARFLYVITPYFYSVPPQTERERVIQAGFAQTSGWVYEATWPVIYGRLAGEPGVIDLSRLFDTYRRSGKDVFFDIQHFDAHGAQLVARAIYAALFGAF